MNKKTIIFFLPSLLFLLVFFSFKQVFAQTAQSNCSVVKVGSPSTGVNLPENCNITSSGAGGPAGGTETQMGQQAVQLAKGQIHKTYDWGACHGNLSNVPNGCDHYDCSGLVRWSWYWASGGKVNWLETTNVNWNLGQGTYQRFPASEKANLQPGDILYFTEDNTTKASHTGIYEGTGGCGANDCFVEEYTQDFPGRENSLSKVKGFLGYLRPVVQ